MTTLTKREQIATQLLAGLMSGYSGSNSVEKMADQAITAAEVLIKKIALVDPEQTIVPGQGEEKMKTGDFVKILIASQSTFSKATEEEVLRLLLSCTSVTQRDGHPVRILTNVQRTEQSHDWEIALYNQMAYYAHLRVFTLLLID